MNVLGGKWTCHGYAVKSNSSIPYPNEATRLSGKSCQPFRFRSGPRLRFDLIFHFARQPHSNEQLVKPTLKNNRPFSFPFSPSVTSISPAYTYVRTSIKTMLTRKPNLPSIIQNTGNREHAPKPDIQPSVLLLNRQIPGELLLFLYENLIYLEPFFGWGPT